MRTSVLLFAAANGIAALAQSTTGTVPIGGQCSSSDQCVNGANCYGVTADTIETCGSFQASCTSDDQCATNTCNDGFCNGFLASSLYNLPTSASIAPRNTFSTSTTKAILPVVTAADNSLGLGQACSSSAQCAAGVDCYGVTEYTIKTCGSFQASCTSDDQCATNTCVNGLCGGFEPSSAYRIVTAAPTSSTSA